MKDSIKTYFILVIIILFSSLPLEIYNFSLNNIAYALILIVLFRLAIHLLRNKNLFLKFIAVATLIACMLSTLLFSLRFLLCGWHTIGTLYANKQNSALTLICKTYDCYGTAEDCTLYKSNKLANHIKWVTRFNETPVDTTKWRIVPFSTIEFNQP